MSETCSCGVAAPRSRRHVVLTGGPGAGKTAVLEVIRKQFGPHVEVLPEAVRIVFRGGFPRRPTRSATRCAQRAIFRVQEQLERMADEEGTAAVTLCDRGLLDGLAYWPDDPAAFLAEVGQDRASLLARYDLVIHLLAPRGSEAHHIDPRILGLWEGHPNRVILEAAQDFLPKLDRVIAVLREQLPASCRARLERGSA